MKKMPVRAKAELAAYGAATAGLATLPQLGNGGVHGAVALLGSGCLCWLYHRAKVGSFPKALKACQRGLPVLSGAALYAASATVPGTSWWEMTAPVAWGGIMAAWLPITRARWVPGQNGTAALPTDFESFVARLWAEAPVSQGTRLTSIRQRTPGRPDFTALVVAPKGTAVPRMDPTDIAAAFHVPEPRVSLEPEPKASPSIKRLTVTPSAPPRGVTFETMWAERVASPDGAIPGSTVVRIEQRPGKVMILAQVEPGQVVRLNHAQLCSAFGVKAEAMRLIAETDGGSQALITLYDTAPLTGTRKATRELVTPDANGYWVLGTAHDGTDAEARLFGETGALHGYVVGVTGSGKTVAFVLCLAAEANAGAVSWMASLDPDAQLTAAGAYIDRQGSGRPYAARATRAAVALMSIRGQINKEVGHDFSAASPYPLLMLSLDEYNGLCDDSADGQEIAQNAVYIAERGRKYGIGIRFGGQTLDLARTGGDRSLREQTRSGTGIVLRTVSGISDRQATEGMLPDGVSLAQIPTVIGGGLTMAQRMAGITQAERGEPTAGMGHVLNGDAPRMMRALYVHLPKDGTGHNLDDIFPEGGAVNTLNERETQALGNLYGDWNTDDGDTSGTGGAAAVRPAAKPVRTTVKDKILAVLTGEMTSKQIRDAVDAAPGSIRNALSELADEGRIAQTDHGVYAPADA